MAEPRFIRIRARRLGGHVHTSWWSARRVDGSYAGIGQLVVDEHDWAALAPILDASPLVNIVADPKPGEKLITEPCGSECIGMCMVVKEAAASVAIDAGDVRTVSLSSAEWDDLVRWHAGPLSDDPDDICHPIACGCQWNEEAGDAE